MSYPTDPEFQSVNFRSNSPVTSNTSISGKRTVRSLNAQRWEFSARYDRLTKAEFGPVYAFLISQGGQLGEFSVTPTEISSARGTASGTCTITAGASAGAGTVTVGLTGTLLKGDLIKFSNHTKVYMVTEDRSGNGTLTFYPNLLTAVTTSHTVVYDDVPVQVRLVNDIQEFELNSNNQYTFEVDFRESY